MSGTKIIEKPLKKRKIMVFYCIFILHSVVVLYASFLDAGNPDVISSWLVPRKELYKAKFFPHIHVESSLPLLCIVDVNQDSHATASEHTFIFWLYLNWLVKIILLHFWNLL